METVSALLAICVGNSSVTGEFPAQRPVTRSFDVYRWVNNSEAGDLRRYLAHYDVIAMIPDYQVDKCRTITATWKLFRNSIM